MALGRRQIEQTFISAGGNPTLAPLMAAIAERESGGRARINNRGTNSNGTTDWGLWQVNDVWRHDPVVGPLFRSGAILTPAGNAKAAVRILSVQGPRAWSTFNPATDSRYLNGFGGSGPLGHRAGSLNRQARPVTITMSTPARSSQGLDVPVPDLSSLAALLGQSQPQQPVTSYIAPPSFTGQRYLPGRGRQLPYVQQPVQSDNGLAAKLAAIGSLTGQSLAPQQTPTVKQSVTVQGSQPAARSFGGHPAQITKLKGVTSFAGKPVAKWIAPILEYARQHGWKGTVNSGYRSDAQQTQIYKSGVRPAALPMSMGGHGSNHEFKTYPGGAVDVTDAQTLAAILARSPYRHLLVYAGAKDPVHFSHPHAGAY